MRKKYEITSDELVEKVNESGRDIMVLSLELVTSSKVRGHWIYKMRYFEKGKEEEDFIIGQDMTDALARFVKIHNFGVPHSVRSFLADENVLSEELDDLQSEQL